MMESQFDIMKINIFKELLIRLREPDALQSVRVDFNLHFKDDSTVALLLIGLELINGAYDIAVEDIERFYEIDNVSRDFNIEDFPAGHPVSIFLAENQVFISFLEEIDFLVKSYEATDNIDDLKIHITRLGEFQKHFHRKEKLFFPILERYGHYTPTRLMWRRDDRVYALYQGVIRQIDHVPDVDFIHIQKTYAAFRDEFIEMIFQEEKLMLPILIALFSEADWNDIAAESDAFGYALVEVDTNMVSEIKKYNEFESRNENIPFGSGYLTIEETNLILNNLPLEITFVDKNSVFKYFNNITKASDMMFIRTPISLGRNVANCHPPKSLKKVMRLIRDLKTKKRTFEEMWFKKGDQYIHITYKALFDEADEYLGMLEYVQDIQPFFELPSEVKTGLSKIE